MTTNNLHARGVLTRFLLLFGFASITAASTPTYADDNCAFLSYKFWRTATVDQVEACIRAGANIETRDKNGWTPLHAAALGTAETVTALVTAGAEIDARGKFGWTPLHRAAASGITETVTALVTAGANIEARVDDGWTPLHLAAKLDTSETAIALIDAGADIKARGENGWTPLYLAASGDNLYQWLYHLTVAHLRWVMDVMRSALLAKKFHASQHLSTISS